ncbi:MAG TPA: hypothetical protein VLB50_05860, partial [Ignavibacteriaceae bacterium]|nr:hypothetical protein [Ignavibacteriaceae bacterium]
RANDHKAVQEIYTKEWERHFSKRIFIANKIQNTILRNYTDKLPFITRFLLPFSISATRN